MWGKHIGVSGTTTGVFGEVASTSGTAISSQNTASGSHAFSTTLAVAEDNALGQICTTTAGTNGADFNIRIWNDGNVAADSFASFVAYKNLPTAGPPMASDLANPDGLRKWGNHETWFKKDPKGFESWRKKFAAWQIEQSRTAKFEAPRDGQNTVGP